jgi:LmbE family N-acetylglucosaminyl deacetylase
MKVLAIAVHPDDETLGCGGTLLKHIKNGDEVHWLLLTSAQRPKFSDEMIAQQKRQIEAVLEAYPFSGFDWIKLATTELEMLALNDIIEPIKKVVEKIRPELIYIPNRSDVHSDHRVSFQACMAVMKSFYMKSLGIKKILACEVISETDAAAPLPENIFLPQIFNDVSKEHKRKLEIMALFESELHPGFMPRSLSSIEAFARYRGSTIGVEYAEAFMLIREIV